MPPNASFLPGFWLLVPGALGLIGLTQVAGDSDVAGTEDLVATIVSIFAVAVGVLCGTLLLASASATGAGWSTRCRHRCWSGTRPCAAGEPEPRPTEGDGAEADGRLTREDR